jgi:glycosyltransferase involved in cell wall biosynthesis
MGMNVLMFGWEYPPHISGGLGTASQGLIRGFGSFSDISVTFVLPRTYGDEPDDGMKLVSAGSVVLTGNRLKKYLIHREKGSSKYTPHYSAYSEPGKHEETVEGIKSGKKLPEKNITAGKPEFTGKYSESLFDEVSWYGLVGAEIAKGGSFDVIHSHDWLTYPAGVEARKVSGKPLVVHVHATEFDRSGINYNSRIFEIEKYGMQVAEMVIAVSNFTRNTIIEQYKIDPVKVVTVHNAVDHVEGKLDHSSVKVSGGERIVTFMGRITWQKGPEFFVQAAQKVLQRMDNVRFVMAGSGDMMGRMMKYAAKCKIADRFHFTGFLKGSDVARMYSMSDLFIMPSISEPFGIAPLEALQRDVPVIISKQSGVAEVLKHAVKVDFWDIDAMADAIYGILNYPALSRHIRSNGNNDVCMLKWSDSAGRVREIYYLATTRQTG